MSTHESLHSVREQLRKTVPEDDKFRFIAIRLMLRTGVNINDPAPRHVDNPLTIARVLEVITALGFEL